MNKTKAPVFLLLTLLALGGPVARAGGWELPDSQGLPTDFDASIMNVINWMLGFVATLSVLVIIYGGLVYVASSGDQERTKQGKQAVKYAIMGLAMAGVSYAVVRVVVETILR